MNLNESLEFARCNLGSAAMLLCDATDELAREPESEERWRAVEAALSDATYWRRQYARLGRLVAADGREHDAEV